MSVPFAEPDLGVASRREDNPERPGHAALKGGISKDWGLQQAKGRNVSENTNKITVFLKIKYSVFYTPPPQKKRAASNVCL